ncbi:MAG: hypothetical protein P4L83_09475 [Nevskia sp.]|nr:hypothetical protein [Nevskia sp.]
MADTKMDLALLYGRIGRIAANWAYVEMAMVHCIRSAQVLGIELPKGEAPQSLSKRKHLLKSAFKTLPELEPFKDEAKALLSRCGERGHKRNEVIHNAAMKALGNGKVRLVGFESDNGNYRPKRVELSGKQMDKIAEDILQLASDMADFSNRVALSLVPRD